MAEVEELLDEVTVRMPSAAQLRARGDRRLARRRSGAVAMAVVAVAGAVTLAVLPGNDAQETRPAKAPTASQSAEVGNTPYKKNGVVDLKTPKALPLYGQWHWHESNGPALGPVGGCSTVDQVLQRSSGWSYDRYFQGDRGAKASHRYTEYDGPSDLSTTLSGLREALSGCGLTSQGASTGPEGQTVDRYTGTIDHRQARIVVEYGDRWLSVVKESGGTQGN
ncbi:hypothetical protein [Streptomyces sp. NBC_00078]|uniref:hypothetical protein n=1 Tax=unclassified Streptomyces TaxID=2593676 RepID=UPI00224DA92F|nr:hypothetical protein [Streptomyces sp. NBC_00078]MCX5423396.1 hypothetical protein [Streptomyces sp. NBC_00078]